MSAKLTENEVAARLRCSASKVKRLRLDGKLAYFKGRPVLIDEADVDAYLESLRIRAEQKAAISAPKEKPKAMRESPAARAMRVWMRRQNALKDKAR